MSRRLWKTEGLFLLGLVGWLAAIAAIAIVAGSLLALAEAVSRG